jgi:hypothetical protein
MTLFQLIAGSISASLLGLGLLVLESRRLDRLDDQ